MSDISSTDFEWEMGRLDDLISQQAWKMDAQLHVQIYKHAELNTFRSQIEGRKIYDEKLYVRILAPANRLNVIEREMTAEDKQRFQRQLRAFLERGEQLLVGTPISELPSITQSQVMELRALKVDTVEQLAGMSDNTAQLLGTGGAELKQRAVRFLDSRKDSEQLAATNRDLQKQIEELRALVESRSKEAGAANAEVKVSDVQALAK